MLNVLSPLQKDLLAEIFNLGMGQAVNAISQLTGKEHEILFSIPDAKIVPMAHFLRDLHTGTGTTMVMQLYNGDINGSAVMYYPELAGQQLTQLLIGSNIPLDKIDRLESDAMAEIGNIFINFSMSNLSEMIGARLSTGIPQLVHSDVLRSNFATESEAILIDSNFKVEDLDVNGTISFVLNNIPMKALLQRVDTYLETLCETV